MINLFKQRFGDGGIQALKPQEAQAKLASQQPPYLLDVREPDEYKAGHIAGATLIPLGELRARMGELPGDREILCVCLSGARSGVAARQLTAMGFKCLNLGGGMFAWQRAGLPITR
jgi:rhodanese-related sulfurtransferase